MELAFGIAMEPMAQAIGTRGAGIRRDYRHVQVSRPDGLRRRLHKLFGDVVGPVGVVLDVEARPIVKARAAAGFFGDVKAQRVDEVQRAARGDTGAAYVAGVVGDFGVDEDDLEHGEG